MYDLYFLLFCQPLFYTCMFSMSMSRERGEHYMYLKTEMDQLLLLCMLTIPGCMPGVRSRNGNLDDGKLIDCIRDNVYFNPLIGFFLGLTAAVAFTLLPCLNGMRVGAIDTFA